MIIIEVYGECGLFNIDSEYFLESMRLFVCKLFIVEYIVRFDGG